MKLLHLLYAWRLTLYTKSMFYPSLFLLELFVLFILSQFFSKIFSQLLLRLTQSQSTTIHILSFLFLPGVIVHELAHWFVAGMLLVRTGEMEFIPQIQGNTVKLGSVAVAKTDPLRRFLIGIAPIIVGLTAMFGIFAYFSSVIPQINWQTAVLAYVFFEIGNTMFSSKKDMEGAIGLFIFLTLIVIVLYVLGVRVQVSQIQQVLGQQPVADFFRKADAMLLFPIVVNVLLCLPNFLRKRRYY
jgi:hypothetical protein